VSDTTELLDVPQGPAGDATVESAPPNGTAGPKAAPRRRGTGLTGMVLSELQAMAAQLGISGTAKMRKSQLIDAIRERQGGGSGAEAAPARGASEAAQGTESADVSRRASGVTQEQLPQPADTPAEQVSTARQGDDADREPGDRESAQRDRPDRGRRSRVRTDNGRTERSRATGTHGDRAATIGDTNGSDMSGRDIGGRDTGGRDTGGTDTGGH
jgi:transcription termination factor Rho